MARSRPAAHEPALALDPTNVDAAGNLAYDYQFLGEFEKSLEYFYKAIRGSPHDPELAFWYAGESTSNFGLKNYDLAIEQARQAIAMNPNFLLFAHANLVAALALTGRDAEARDALQRYLALPSVGTLKSIAAWKAYNNSFNGDPRHAERNERALDGLRKAGMPE